MPLALRIRPVALTLAVLLVAGVLTFVTSPMVAQAAPTLSMTASPSTSVLAGDSIDHSVTVSNPGDAVEYNVSVTATLEPDVVYDAGSTSPTEFGDPTVITDATTGVTTLIWSNVSDLQIGDSLSLGFSATPRTTMPPAVFATYPVGATVPFSAASFANTDPRILPRFDATGAPIASSYTESATAAGSPTAITAITIDKSEPSPESELLRGVHDHTTVFTLDVNVTGEDGVDDVTVIDMLPAQLEFLGCGGVDNSSAPEFAGAPSLTGTPAVAPATCLTPASVSTVQNPAPDGSTTYPLGVYTRIVWDLGDLPAGANVTVQYAAGIPLRANTVDFGGPTPSPAAPFGQAANLDNNTGASTRETVPETSIVNRSRVDGTYLGDVQAPATSAVSDTSTESVTIEDLRIRKSVTPGRFTAGAVATYTVIVDTSEYVSVSAPVMTDTISNGLCPIDDVANYSSSGVAECDPVATGPTVSDGVTTSPLPWTSVVELPGGGFDMTFTATDPIAPSSTRTVTYQARMRSQYENGSIDGRPTVAGDSFSNDVEIDAISTPIAGTGESGDEPVGDGSGAAQGTRSQSIDKRVKPRVVGEDCDVDVGSYTDPPEPLDVGLFGFRKGDEVCFRLTVDFASGVFNRNAVVTDFLPPGVAYAAGSMTALPSNTVLFDFDEAAAAAGTANPIWEIGTPVGPDRYAAPGAVFDVVLAGIVDEIPTGGTFDLTGNLMKMVVANTPGATSSFRDEVPFAIVPAVPLELDKTVVAVDTPVYSPPPGVATPVVQAGSVASYEIDVTHAGSAADGTDYSVRGLQVFDVLPQPLRCADVSALSNPAFSDCFDDGDAGHPSVAGDATRSVIVWDFVVDPLDVDAEALFVGDVTTLSYDVTWPSGIAPEVTFTNTAGVRSFEAFTADTGVGTAYFPADNIDASVPPEDWTARAADDTASVRTRDVTVDKVFSSPILSGNTGPIPAGTSGQAVIGEVVTYTYSATIPAGTTVYGARLTDALPSGWSVAASPAPSFTFEPDAVGAPGVFAPAPAGVVLNATNGRLDFGSVYTNASTTDQRYSVTIATVVPESTVSNPATVSANRSNRARFQAATTPTGPSNEINRSRQRSIAVIQPTPSLAKSNDAGGPVVGGQLVTYTLTASQPDNRPSLYDSWIVDCLPAGLTYVATTSTTTQVGAGAQVPTPFTELSATAGPADGCAAGTTRLAWRVDTIDEDTTVRIEFTATVDLTAVGGDVYTNTAALTGSSLENGDRVTPDVPADPAERVYTATAPANDVTVAGSNATKDADRATAPIGDTVTYTATGAIGASTNFYQVALVDTLPAGIDPSSVTVVSAECTYDSDGTPCPGVSPTLWPPVAGPGGDLVFFFGDLAADVRARTLEVVYTAVVSDVAPNTAGVALTNSVEVRWDVTDGADPSDLPSTWDRTGAPATDTVVVVEPSLVTSKAVDDATPALTDTVTYTVTVANTGSNLSPAYDLVVVDDVPDGLVVGTISDGGTFDAASRQITWDAADLPGPLAPDASIELTYTATFDDTVDGSNRLLFGDAALQNVVDNTDYAGLPAGGRDYTGNTATADVAPEFPDITLAKAVLDAPPAYIGGAVAWQITGTNTGDGTAASVDVTDVLPPNWTYVPGSSSATVGAGPASTADPSVSGPATAVQLDWSLGAVPAGASFSVTFQAVASGAVTATPGIGSSTAHVNTVDAAVTDLTGASGNASRPYDPPSATASTRIDAVDVEIVSTTPAVAVAGTPHTWTLTVSNNGPDTAVGPFTVTDIVPAGTTFSSATGTGWTCSHDGAPTGGVVTCVRTAGSDTLASGVAFPAISMVVDVDADTASGTVYTDDAEVTITTFDTDPSNNTDDASTTVTTRADVAVSKSHTGSGIAGTPVTWTVTVSNAGPSVSRSDVVTVDTLPAGVSFTGFSAVDADLSCSHDGSPTAGTITCTRSADMPVGATDSFSFTADIDPAQLVDVTNTATVTPTTADPDPSNDSATDTVTLVTSADLAVTKTAVGIIEAGSPGRYEITVSNAGPSDAGAFSFTDTLPAGMTVTGVDANTGGADCGVLPATGSVTCTYASGIDLGGTYSLAFDVVVDSGVTGLIANTVALNPGVTPDPNPANDTATVDNGVAVSADLAIVKTGPATVTAGTAVTWSLQVTNNGPSDDPGPITVTDVLPAEVSYVGATAVSGAWSCVHDGAPTAGTLTCTLAAGLVDTASATVSVEAFVAADAGPASSSNTATVASPTVDPQPANDSSTSPFDVVDDVELDVTKTTVGADPVVAGEATGFVVSVRNAGPSTADDVVVTDVVPASMTVTGLTGPAGWTCVVATGVCSTPTLAPGDTADISVDATVAANVPAGTTLTNTATAVTSSPGDDPSDNTDTADVDVIAVADLSLVKAHSGDPVRAGDVTTFSFAVANAGPSDAVADVAFTDVLPVGLTFVSSSGPWACAPGDPAAPGGQPVTCTYEVAGSPAPLPAGTSAPAATMVVQSASSLAPSAMTNTAAVSSPTTDPDPSNDTGTVDVTIVTETDLEVTKVAATTPAVIGEQIEWTVTVSNTGPSDAADVVVTDTVPASVTGVVVDGGTAWDCSATVGNDVVCAHVGVLPTSDVATFAVTAEVTADAYPQIANTASATTSTPEPDVSDNTATATTDVAVRSDLSIAKSHDGTPRVGGTVAYTLTVTNTGPTENTGPVVVTDVLPAGLTFASADGADWSCGATDSTVTCTHGGTFAVDGVSEIVVVADVGPDAWPSVTNTASVTSPHTDIDESNNVASDPTEVDPLVELTLTKTAGAVVDGVVSWELTVTNEGPNASVGTLTITDDLPAGLTFQSATGVGWTCMVAGQAVTCTSSVALAVAESSTLTLVTAVSTPPGGTVTNTASVAGGGSLTVVDAATSVVVPTVPPPTPGPGGTIPVTGADSQPTAALAAMLLALGLALQLGTRGRRRLLR